MNLKYGIKNIVKFILILMIISIELLTVYLIICDSHELDSLYSLIPILLFWLFVISFSVKYAINQIVPKYLKVMRAVKKYISFPQLKELVKDEVFLPVDLPVSIKKHFSKSELKSFNKGFLVSENWVYVNNVLIPKKMIVSIKKSFLGRRDTFSLSLVNNANYEFAIVYCENDKTTKKLITYFSRNIQISNMRNIDNCDKYIEEFKNAVHTNEDFIKYIQWIRL